SALGWVSREDWARYPQGRIRRGELLIEVKGLASKVAIVPDDFPEETLVTGTLFKLSPKTKIVETHYLLAYLLSKYGRGFRERCLTNTLIGFVSKEDLYAIPVPVPSKSNQKRISKLARSAIDDYREYERKIGEAESLVEEALGLGNLDVSPNLSYS